MSAAIVQLRVEFSEGWAKAGGRRYDLEIRSLGINAPDFTYDAEVTDEGSEVLLSSISLPCTASSVDSVRAIVVAKFGDLEPPPSDLPDKDDIYTFRRICSKAGAALSTEIHNSIARYGWSDPHEPAAKWFSLMACLNNFTLYDADGTYCERQYIRNPWQVSIDAIEYLRINTEPSCHVTLSQMAGMVNRDKRTLERLVKKQVLPEPAVQGGGGRPNEWQWRDVRPILQAEYGRSLPEVFPADRYVR